MRMKPEADIDCWLDPNFIDPTTAASYFQSLSQEIAWRQDSIQMYGKKIKVPRLQAFMGDQGIQYSYSGLTLIAEGWHPVVHQIKKQISQFTGVEFNAVLINLYRTGQDSMGWHRDNEPELGPCPVIASLSLGAERRFLLRNKAGVKREYLLGSGSLFWMGERLQNEWEHSVPKTQKPIKPRINLTFRKIL